MPSDATVLHCTLCTWEGTHHAARWAGIAPNGSTFYLCDSHHTMWGYRFSSIWLMTESEVSRRLAGESPWKGTP